MNYSVPVCQIEFLNILPLCTSLSRDHEHLILDKENNTNLNCFENIKVLLKWLIHIHSSDILSYLWKVDFDGFTTGLKHTHLNKIKLLFIIIMQRSFFFSLSPWSRYAPLTSISFAKWQILSQNKKQSSIYIYPVFASVYSDILFYVLSIKTAL